VRTQIDLSAGEHVIAVEGTFGSVVITALTFRMSPPWRALSEASPIGGGDDEATTTRFSIPAASSASGGAPESGWLLSRHHFFKKIRQELCYLLSKEGVTS
jgi:hypothetical protein